MTWWIIALSVLAGYLLGSLSMSVIVSELIYKSDVRKHGSGNAGATNMARVYGWKGGLAALVGWILLVRGNHTGTAVIFAASILPALKSFLIFVTSVLALFSAADFGAQALAFVKDLVTFVTAGLPIVLMLFWKGRGY